MAAEDVDVELGGGKEEWGGVGSVTRCKCEDRKSGSSRVKVARVSGVNQRAGRGYDTVPGEGPGMGVGDGEGSGRATTSRGPTSAAPTMARGLWGGVGWGTSDLWKAADRDVGERA